MNMEEKPLVSVLMTAYNREEYIAEAIESVLASTYLNFELIIVDDCSADNTVDIAKRYEKGDNRVKVYVNEINVGQFPNRNTAAEYAKGKYIKYFDSDDVLFTHALEVMVSSMEKFPEAGAGLICYNEDVKGQTPLSFLPRASYINHYFKGSTLLIVGPSGSIFRRSVFEKSEKFNIKSGILADTLLMLQIAAIYPIVGFEKDLFYWRTHDQQVTEGQKKTYEMIMERFYINQSVLNSKDCPLKDAEILLIKGNLKKIIIRKFPRIVFKMPFYRSVSLIKKVQINIFDLFKSLIPNKIIEN